MANEIKYINSSEPGLALTAMISQNGVRIGEDIGLVESGTLPGHYFADFPGNVPFGAYIIEIFNGVILKGDAVELYWDGTQEVTLLTLFGDSGLLEIIRDHARAANLQTQAST